MGTVRYTWPPPTGTLVRSLLVLVELDACSQVKRIDILEVLLPHSPPSLLSSANNAGSTPLHWAALNKHLPAAQALVRHPGGPGAKLVDIKNKAGHTPLGEAENAEWEDGARWFVEVMDLEEGEGGEKGEEEDGKELEEVEVEITDAEGGVAKMTLGKAGKEEKGK